LGLRTVRKVARERGKVRGKRLGHGPSHVTSGSARYRIQESINRLTLYFVQAKPGEIDLAYMGRQEALYILKVAKNMLDDT
jgi:hypothetical protein